MILFGIIAASRRSAAPSGAEVGTLSSVSITGPTSPATEAPGARVSTLCAVCIIGPI